MPAVEREASRDRDAVVRHQHSFPESGRSSVPMWDSSDPERAPPPLPLNPGNGSPTVKANTSASIAAAAKQIVEKARECAPLSSYTTNQSSQASPERSLIKGAHHKRMQSLQTGSVKDLRSYLDGNRSPERSPERPTQSNGFPYGSTISIEDFAQPLERSSTPTPTPKDLLKDTPSLRPATRATSRPLLGENTPPSATMLALQTMQVPDPPLDDVGNMSGLPNGTRVHANYDFANQLTNLTTIATNLQKEMANLSRRSKDNATDLVKLQQATHTRDEDIRQSIKDLHKTVNSSQNLLGTSYTSPTTARSTSAFTTPHYLEAKPFQTPPSASKSWTLPRAASAHSFLDEPRVGSPSPYSVEGAASVAMLEKIIREMNTKEGQDRLLGTLSEMLEKSRKENVEAARKVEELSEFIKDKSQSHALVPVRCAENGAPQLDLNFDTPRGSASSKVSGDAAAAQEILKLLQRVRDSVALSGGTSAEVKGLVRDLRGEVLGMGRELGKKLDQIGDTQLSSSLDHSIERGQGSEHAEEVQRIVEEGISELKQYMSSVMQERARQDDNTFQQLATAPSAPNREEMLAVVQHALHEHSRSTRELTPDVSGVDRDGVLAAVKDGLKDFEPNIELQQFGLERDEILAVLKEGLEDYQNTRSAPVAASIDKGEIFEVMQEALKDFRAPFPADQLQQIKDELLENVQHALEHFQSHTAGASPIDSDAVHAVVVEAVQAGFATSPAAGPRELAISRDDLFDAVKASLDGTAIPFGGLGEQVLGQLQELFETMRQEFQQYSTANGRDTEQVLDAIGDGLEKLRAEVETYVDRAQDVTGKDEIVETIKDGLERLRTDVQGYCSQAFSGEQGRGEMLEYIKAEFEQLHGTLADRQSERGLDGSQPTSSADILLAVREGMDAMRSHSDARSIDGQGMEDLSEAMKVEFDHLKSAILQANAADKGELIETIQDSLGAMHARLGGSELSNLSGASDEIIHVVRDEMAALKEMVHDKLSDIDKDAIVTGIRQSMADLRIQLSADQTDGSAEALGAIKEELERFRESMGSALVPGDAGSRSHAEALDAIRSGLDEVKHTTSRSLGGGMSDEQLEAIRGEFENIRASIATSLVHGSSNEDVLDAVRLGLDDLRSHLEKKLDNPEAAMSNHSQVLDALHEGLDSMRTDIVKTLDKPLDMTVNYEILDTLKDGMATLRAQMDKLVSAGARPKTPQGGEIVLADGAEVAQARDVTSGDSAAHTSGPHSSNSNINEMQVLLTQLHIKIEAMDRTIQDLPAGGPSTDGPGLKDNLSNVETVLRDIQDSIALIAARSEPGPESAARKEDTDAIETLLRNTKAHLEEMGPAGGVTQESIDDIKAAIDVANDAVTQLAEKVESKVAGKDDVAVIEVLAHDLKSAMDEIKEHVHAEKPEALTKLDLDVIGVLVTDIKTKVEDINLPELEDMPTKADVEQIQALIAEFRESHDKMRDSYETDIAVTAKAFDDRKQEYEDTVTQISEIKTVLDDVRLDLLDKVLEGDSGLAAINEVLHKIEERSSNDAVVLEVRDVMEKIKEEFERAYASIEGIKVDHAESAELALEKQSEHKGSVISELSEKLDGLFDGLMTKYDDAQLAAEEKFKTMEEQSEQQRELFESTRTMTDELKLSIDTLGTALTNFMGDLPATVEKMAHESQTVFSQVEQTHRVLEETASGLHGEHSVTRDEIAKVLMAIDGIQGDMTEHHPRFIVTLEEVRALINQHYEHSQKTTAAADEHLRAVRELQDQLKAGFQAQTDGLRSQQEELKTALPALMPPPIETSIPGDKYDDTEVHSKLDRLMGHVEAAASRSTQLERLDQIHEKVMATAAEVSAFVSAQNKQITETHEHREKEAEEIALVLERRQERKDQLEADITVLNEEKESLQHAVEALKAEKEALAAQKARFTADVSSLETALHIRREELHAMDHKAAVIEKRILDGVLNQQRVLLLSKASGNGPPPAKKNPAKGRDLRVPSDASTMSAHPVTSSVRANHALAMRTRQAPNSAERRIMSLNQINHNAVSSVPRNTQTGLVSGGTGNNVLSGMKRSHSVKTTPFTTWGKQQRNASISGHPYSYNKENETLSEEEDEDYEHSEAGTERHHVQNRRVSYLSTTDDGAGSMAYASTDSYETPAVTDEPGSRRVSYGAQSEMTYDSTAHSYADHRESLGSSADGVVDAEVNDEVETTRRPLRIEGAPAQKERRMVWAAPSDSGIGTDLPSAMLSGEEKFFK